MIKRHAILMLTILVVACSDVDGFAFETAPGGEAAAGLTCEAAVLSTLRAQEIFAHEQFVCISDTDFNTMPIVEIVTRQTQSQPTEATRAELGRLGTISRYGSVAWGLNDAGDVTFLTTESYMPLGDARVHVGAGFSGCVPVADLELSVRPTQDPGCVLQIEPAGGR